MNFFVGAFYDGVQLLGMALNETLTMGGDIKDGKAITKLMWNRSFHGKSSQRTDNFYFICRSCRCLNENLYCNLSYFNVFSPLFTFYNVGISKRVSKFLYLHMILISFHWCFRTFPPTDVQAITYCVTYSAAVNSDILKGSEICFFFIIKELLRYYFYKSSKCTILWNYLLRKML